MTKTEYFTTPRRAVTWINELEAEGWSVKTIKFQPVPRTTMTHLIVVMEKPARD